MRSDLRSVSGLGFRPKPYTQNANERADNLVKRNLKKLNRISDVLKEIRKLIEEQDIQIELSLTGQGEWKVAPGYEEFKITEDKFYRMTTEQRLRFKERFSAIRPEDSGIMYPLLAILHQIFNKAEKYVYSSPESTKSSPVDGNTACSLIVASSSNPDLLHVFKFNSSGKYECDVNCISYKSYKIYSHTVAAAERKSELRNFAEDFKKHSKNKVNDLVDVNMS